MAFPLVPVVLAVAPIVAIKAAIDRLVKPYTDEIISTQLAEARDTLRESIIGVSDAYDKNFFVSAILDAAVIAFVFLVYLVFKVNMVSIALISVCTIVILIRFIANGLKCVKRLLPYSDRISSFAMNCMRYKSFSMAGKMLITDYCHKVYQKNTTKLTRTIHGIASKAGAVKSFYAIKNDAISEIFSLLGERRIRSIIIRIFLISIVYGVAAFLVKLSVFSFIMKMNAVELIAYPFTKVLPVLAKNVSSWL